MEEKNLSKTINSNLPKVSIIITTYNRPLYLGRAIESCLYQDYRNIEIIVVDDNNPNTSARLETEILMKNYEYDNVKYIKHIRNKNGAAARNTGIKESKGDIITFLDDDDFYYSNKVSTQVEYMLNTGAEIVYCGWIRDGKSIIPSKSGNLSFEILSGTSLIYTNAIMVDKEVSMSVGNWNECFKRNQEAVYLLKLFSRGYNIIAIPKVLFEFDTSDRSNASNSIQNEKDFEFFLEFHKNVINEIKKEDKNKAKKIYIYRYRGIMLSHIKEKRIKRAVIVYLKSTLMFPLKFNKELLKYTMAKIKGKDVFNV